MHWVVHTLWDKRSKELGGKHTCKNLHKTFPHGPAELRHDVFQETHLKRKEKHILPHAQQETVISIKNKQTKKPKKPPVSIQKPKILGEISDLLYNIKSAFKPI